MVLLLTSDCATLGAYVGGHLMRHLGVWSEERHRGVVAELEERQMQQKSPFSTISNGNLKSERHPTPDAQRAGRCRVSLEILVLVLTSCHYLHIWTLHGTSFGLVDGVLALHLNSTLSAAGRKMRPFVFREIYIVSG